MSAELRATLAALWERAQESTPADDWPAVTRLTSGPELAKVPPGFTAWAVGAWPDADAPGGRHVVVLPTLDPAAPLDVHRRLMARVVALGSGRCPLCSAVAGLDREPVAPGEQGRAVFHVLPLYVRVRHATGCPAEFTPDEAHLFPVYRYGDDPDPQLERR